METLRANLIGSITYCAFVPPEEAIILRAPSAHETPKASSHFSGRCSYISTTAGTVVARMAPPLVPTHEERTRRWLTSMPRRSPHNSRNTYRNALTLVLPNRGCLLPELCRPRLALCPADGLRSRKQEQEGFSLTEDIARQQVSTGTFHFLLFL